MTKRSLKTKNLPVHMRHCCKFESYRCGNTKMGFKDCNHRIINRNLKPNSFPMFLLPNKVRVRFYLHRETNLKL